MWPSRRRAFAAAVLVGLAGTSLPAQAPLSAASDTLLSRAAEHVAQARTMRARFEQTLTNPDIKQTRTSRGEFMQQGAAKFAFRFTDPSGDAIVADGAAVWVYLPSSARGQALKLPLTEGAQLDLVSQFLTKPKETYRITEGKASEIGGRPVVSLSLVPKLQTAPFSRAQVWLDREEALVRQMEVTEASGLVRRIRFSDIRTGVELPAGALAFSPPANTKIVDATALMGGRLGRP
ncbi:MAG: outer membrane lipoprotein carrier protein LolA [Gemmatimonadetes bacterium]|nr:outer membrane lipoprotein carrier protein LolA [Gemmatimonadota bacterium]